MASVLVASIKEEFLLPIPQKVAAKNEEVEEKTTSTESKPPILESEAPDVKTNKKRKGRNHERPKPPKIPKANKLCASFWPGLPAEGTESGCRFENCKFSHDVKGYLENKPEDIAESCYNFKTTGFCRFGVACRFGSNHIELESNTSIVETEKRDSYLADKQETKSLEKEVQRLLWKRKYDLSKATDAISFVESEYPVGKPGKGKDVKAEPLIGPADDSDITKLRQDEKKKIDWNDKLYLAPLTTLGNLPFRRVCKEFGADVTCGEMALSLNLLNGSYSEWALVRKHASEDLFGVQVCGGNPALMIKCSQLIQEQTDADFVDINMGCPIDMIFNQGSGSALMRRVSALKQMVMGMHQVLDVPVTLKMRAGIHTKNRIAHEIIGKAKLWDVGMITVHGRSKEQRYVRDADWSYIDQCAKAADPIPVFGSGDVLTYEQYEENRRNTSVSGIMIARGAIIKPWLFTEIKEKRNWDITSSERFDFLKKYVNYGLEHWGCDSDGVENTRRFLLEWLSFLYRYIPVGVLEGRQFMNLRPERYKGRNELETLMASNNVNDWIKISEMLLGKVPDNFAFLPKHKANSWT